jgi:hypothetical protein|tara:strand:+ start:56 stop:649 length:594 start_codon:yes stop_codon:yes gene_type:complete
MVCQPNPEEETLMDIFEDLIDEGDKFASVDTGTGKQLSDLVRKLRSVEQDIEDAELNLKALKAEKHRLSVENIPGLMDEMGVDRLDVDGVSVSRKMIVHASIPQDRKEEAFAWLRENGLDDIIKNDVTCSFGKGEDNVAGDVVGILQEKGFDPKTKTHVHPSTLKAFVKERIVDGKPIDLDMFGAFIANAAEIRRKA